MTDTPPDAQVFIDGCWYKVKGFKVFYHNNIDWLLSCKSPGEIREAVEKLQRSNKYSVEVLA